MARVDQMAAWFGDEEAKACYDLIKSGSWLTDFKKCRELEAKIAEYCKVKYCDVVPNGTMGLQIALMALGIVKGNTVIVPAYTMPASAYAVSLAGGEVIFADINKETLCISPDIITPDFHAIMHVSINGRHGHIEQLTKNACESNVALIEDACQSLGSWYNGKHLGTFGDIGVLSLNSFKVISAGQGGMIITNDENLHNKVKKIKDYGRAGGRGSSYEILGMNAKYTDLQAVVALEQFKKMDWRLNRKKEMYHHYIQLLEDMEDYIEPINTNLIDCSPWYMDFLCEKRDELINYLASKEIETQPFYPPLHRLPYYKNWNKVSFPNAEYVAEHGIWLPSSSFLKDSDIEYICEQIVNFYNGGK